MTESADPTKIFRLSADDARDARGQGFRVFRAWRSCGCCQIEMAFADLENVKREFDPISARFADTVRDDMGHVYEAVNTGRGYIEVKSKVDRITRPIAVLPVLVVGDHPHPRI